MSWMSWFHFVKTDWPRTLLKGTTYMLVCLFFVFSVFRTKSFTEKIKSCPSWNYNNYEGVDPKQVLYDGLSLQENEYVLLFKIWYLYYVIKLGMIINSIKVTFVSNPSHAISPPLEIDINYSVHTCNFILWY